MDGEERNASLPILGSHGIFPRTDPTGPRNPVVVTEVGLRAQFTAARPPKTTVSRQKGGKDDLARKTAKIGANPSNPGGQELRGPM